MEPIEIRLVDILRFFKKYFLVFIFSSITAATIGYALSYSMQNKYTSHAKLLPEQSTTLGGSFRELATLAGIANRTKTEAVRPDLYPDILSSNQFLLNLLMQSFYDSEDQTVTLFEYFQRDWDKENKAKPFTDAQIKGLEKPLRLSKNQQKLLKLAASCISSSYGKLDGVITIRSEMPDPVLAASIVQYGIEYLSDFVTTYRLEKSDAQVKLLENQVSRANQNFIDALTQLNSFRDRNRNLYSFSSRTEESKLEGNVAKAQSIYFDLSQKLEIARLQYEEVSPVFKIIDLPIVPYATSSPRRLVIAFLFAFISFFCVLAYILFYKKRIHRFII